MNTHLNHSEPPCAMTTDIENLRSDLHDLDELNQEATANISSIAQLAYAWLTSPEGRTRPEPAFRALRLIRDLAGEHASHINDIACRHDSACGDNEG